MTTCAIDTATIRDISPLKTAEPVTATDTFAEEALRYAQGTAQRVQLSPGEDVEVVVMAVPWAPLATAASGMAVFLLSMIHWDRDLGGLSLACLGLFISAVGAFRIFMELHAIRCREQRTASGMRQSDDNINHTASRYRRAA